MDGGKPTTGGYDAQWLAVAPGEHRHAVVQPGQLPEKAILSQSIFVCRDPLNDSVEVACV